jgi:hypothetical protein
VGNASIIISSLKMIGAGATASLPGYQLEPG